ncbi:hypothetical protein PG994_013937 [Apiospora phragmitis]|uniref:Uncharacterized protein n=1 Tax=Apiospora phragmitis TaxID=2905665 RepID=A0ABR1T2W3_9PEZI
MDRIYELTYLCGCGEGQATSRSNYERLGKIRAVPFATKVVDRVCGECRRKPADFNKWSWKTVAPEKQHQHQGDAYEFDEMFMFLAGLVPDLDYMGVADLEVIVNRVASRLRIDGVQLFDTRGEIVTCRVPERTRRDITKLVRCEIEQFRRQQQQKESGQVRVDVRRAGDNVPLRVVNCKPSKGNLISVGGAGFF